MSRPRLVGSTSFASGMRGRPTSRAAGIATPEEDGREHNRCAEAEDAGASPPRDLGGTDVAGTGPVGSVVVRDLGHRHRRHALCSPAGRFRMSAEHGG